MTLSTCSVFLCRMPAGELIATVGVEFQAPCVAPGLEAVGLDDGAVHPYAVPAHALFAHFGCGLPFGVRPMQNVPIFHEGLDLVEVLRFVPNHAGGANAL